MPQWIGCCCPGTDDFVLNRAVWITSKVRRCREQTATPGSPVTAMAFFRGLKDIAPGDAIELETLEGREMYEVERARGKREE